jgi:hypothetical protein
MKSFRRVALGLFGLALTALLPSCVMVDPGYVALSGSYSTGSSYYAPSYAPSYCAPRYVAPVCDSYAPPVHYHHRSYDSCYRPVPRHCW